MNEMRSSPYEQERLHRFAEEFRQTFMITSEPEGSDEYVLYWLTVRRFALMAANFFKADNDRFNEEQFLSACGIKQ